MTELRDAAVPEQCIYCGRLALGLVGQDFYLAPYAITGDRSFADDRYGQCHLKCLREAGLAEGWARAIEEHYKLRWPDYWESDDKSWRVHASYTMRECVVWNAYGWFAVIPFSAVTASIEPGGSRAVRVAVDSTVGYEGGPYESIFFELRSGQRETLDLVDVLMDLDLTDRLLDRRLVEGATVRRIEVADKRAELPAEYHARHWVDLPQVAFLACKELSRRVVPSGRRRRRR